MRLNYRFSLFTLLVFFTGLSLPAQEALPQYTVRIGNFVNPKPADFDGLHELGFVYANERSMHTDVFIGGFTSKTEANGMVETLKSKNFDNGFVSDLNVKGGNATTMVQLATLTVGDKIDWEKFMQVGRIYVLLENKNIKILTGVFPDEKAAREQLPRIRDLGFTGAFPKTVNNALLHEVGDFETGGVAKKPLIPLDFSDKTPIAKKEASPAPATYDNVTILPTAKSGGDLTAKGVPAAKTSDNGTAGEAAPASIALPDIRPNVKRTSALELQKVLKAVGTYKGSLDGYYGAGTKASFNIAADNDRQLQKYRVLAKHYSTPANEAPKGSLQYYINTLWDNPKTALDGFEASNAPIAKAYRAYFLFVNDGASADVNQLMNEAIIEAFAGKKTTFPKFDPTASYAYFDLDQLLLHIRYLHEVSPGNLAVPCWIFRKHPGAALQAFGPQPGRSSSNLRVGTCGGFWEWEEVQLLHTITSDICPQSESDKAKDQESQSALASLYLVPVAPDNKESNDLEAWNTSLWKGINAWSSRDPMLQEMNTALKLTYFQTWVLLEDYYMDKGFSAKDAKALALEALKAIVGNHLARFI